MKFPFVPWTHRGSRYHDYKRMSQELVSPNPILSLYRRVHCYGTQCIYSFPSRCSLLMYCWKLSHLWVVSVCYLSSYLQTSAPVPHDVAFNFKSVCCGTTFYAFSVLASLSFCLTHPVLWMRPWVLSMIATASCFSHSCWSSLALGVLLSFSLKTSQDIWQLNARVCICISSKWQYYRHWQFYSNSHPVSATRTNRYWVVLFTSSQLFTARVFPVFSKAVWFGNSAFRPLSRKSLSVSVLISPNGHKEQHYTFFWGWDRLHETEPCQKKQHTYISINYKP